MGGYRVRHTDSGIIRSGQNRPIYRRHGSFDLEPIMRSVLTGANAKTSARGEWLRQKSCQGFGFSGGARGAGLPEALRRSLGGKAGTGLRDAGLFFLWDVRTFF